MPRGRYIALCQQQRIHCKPCFGECSKWCLSHITEARIASKAILVLIFLYCSNHSVPLDPCTFTSSSGDSATVECDPGTLCCTGENKDGGAEVRCCPDTTFCGPYHRGSGQLLCLTTRKLISIKTRIYTIVQGSHDNRVYHICTDGTDMPYAYLSVLQQDPQSCQQSSWKYHLELTLSHP